MNFLTKKSEQDFAEMNFFRKIKFILGTCKRSVSAFLLRNLFFLRPIYLTRAQTNPISARMWFYQKIIGINRHAYWPVHFTSIIVAPKNIYAGIDTSPGYANGCYIQGLGKVYIGDYTG